MQKQKVHYVQKSLNRYFKGQFLTQYYYGPTLLNGSKKRPVRIYLPQKKVNKYIRNPYFVNLKAQLLKSCYENCRKLSHSGQGSSIYKSNSVSSHSHSFSGLKVRIRI